MKKQNENSKKPPEASVSRTDEGKNGLLDMLTNEIKKLLAEPKKLIPTIVLAVIWTVLPIVMGFASGANVPIIRFISTLTYANGGIFGGFFGTVGGLFGKAIFAAIVNGLVISICSKKNPFSGLGKSFTGVIGSGVDAIAPFLIGGGVGFILYFFFNITSAPQNCAISVACTIAALQAISKQNGIVFAAVFFCIKKLSKGKAPTRLFVNRIISGLAAGFVISLPITFLRFRFLVAILGIILTALGIFLPKLLSGAGNGSAKKSRA